MKTPRKFALAGAVLGFLMIIVAAHVAVLAQGRAEDVALIWMGVGYILITGCGAYYVS